ncbi:MAG: hypothetical protein UX30_C0007G0011 [Candidatus Saccharibacteria bacterium GW2011_GWA2_46_10]|nr:MAG: hypothetical protein UX30_C0007G0011 [Candidatus Saccharibacteria bacterium GW2011_GWA2_46_10]
MHLKSIRDGSKIVGLLGAYDPGMMLVTNQPDLSKEPIPIHRFEIMKPDPDILKRAKRFGLSSILEEVLRKDLEREGRYEIVNRIGYASLVLVNFPNGVIRGVTEVWELPREEVISILALSLDEC